MLYVIADTLLKVALNTNKTGHHVITDMLLKLKWCKTPIKMVTRLYIITDIVESGIKHQ